MKNEDGYYVTNEELVPEIVEFKRTKVMSERLGDMIIQIATNYSKKGSFFGYTWKDDMVSDAVLTCMKYLHNFDPDKEDEKGIKMKPNPFAYITIICHRAFLTYIKKQNKHSKIKDACYKNGYILENNIYNDKGIDYTLLKK